MKRITERSELVELARELGVRKDWHEPDEQEVDVEVYGSDFDNAGFWPSDQAAGDILERHVIISKDRHPVAAVNLATLLAWASEEGYDE